MILSMKPKKTQILLLPKQNVVALIKLNAKKLIMKPKVTKTRLQMIILKIIVRMELQMTQKNIVTLL